MKKQSFRMTREQAEAHQRKHGFTIHQDPVVPGAKENVRKERMNKTEREFSFILEAQKRKGEILRWQFQGMKLAWGVDPDTGKPMWYTPDFCVTMPLGQPMKMIETKGPHIHYRQQAVARFKGARSDWPEFRFEMWQNSEGIWTRLY